MMLFPSSPSCTTSSVIHSTLPMVIPSVFPSINIKLDRSSYIFLKSQIIPAARAHELESFLLGTKLKPDETIADPVNL